MVETILTIDERTMKIDKTEMGRIVLYYQLDKLKRKFRKKYIAYMNYLDQFDCGIHLATYLSTDLGKMQDELDALIEQMKQLELKINGKIPDALKVKFRTTINTFGEQ
jgi:hypothetical protein